MRALRRDGDVAGARRLRAEPHRRLDLAGRRARDGGDLLLFVVIGAAFGVDRREVRAALHVRLDVERDDVEVALQRQDDALQDADAAWGVDLSHRFLR